MALDKATQQALNAAIKDLKAQAAAKKKEINAWYNTAKKGLKGTDLQTVNNQHKYLLQEVDNWLKSAITTANEAAYGVIGLPTGVSPLTALQPTSAVSTQVVAGPAPIPASYVTPTITAQPGVPQGFQYVQAPDGNAYIMPIVLPGGQYPAAPAGYAYSQSVYGPVLVAGSAPAPTSIFQTPTYPVTSTYQPYYAPTPTYQPPAPAYQPYYAPTPTYQQPAPVYQSPVQSYSPYTYTPADNFDMPYNPVPADVFAPSSATLVMTSPGGPVQTSPQVTQAMVDQANSQYQADDWGNLWPGAFGDYAAQVMVPAIRPVRRIRRRLTTIQALNDLPVLLDGFGQAPQITGLLGSVIGAASNIGGAAITAALTPKGQVQAAPTVIQAPAPAPAPSSGISLNSPWVLGGAAAFAGLMILVIAMKK